MDWGTRRKGGLDSTVVLVSLEGFPQSRKLLVLSRSPGGGEVSLQRVVVLFYVNISVSSNIGRISKQYGIPIMHRYFLHLQSLPFSAVLFPAIGTS